MSISSKIGISGDRDFHCNIFGVTSSTVIHAEGPNVVTWFWHTSDIGVTCSMLALMVGFVCMCQYIICIQFLC